MNFAYCKLIRSSLVLCALMYATAIYASPIEREAWTFIKTDLDLTVTPASNGFAAEGKVTLRNDSQQPQKNLSLQISSALTWNSIMLADDEVQWVAQPYTSDIDHTGQVSEAIVTLPAEVAPGKTVDLNISYSGVIKLNATRLTRVGMPEDIATSADWDQVSEQFTAVRGLGYVTWYPLAIEAANLSEGSNVFDALERWHQRSRESTLTVRFNKLSNTSLITNGRSQDGALAGKIAVSFQSLESPVPTFTYGAFEVLDRPAMTVCFLPQHSSTARDWTLAIEQIAPKISEWFGPPKQKITIIDLGDERASSFEAGPYLFTSLRSAPQPQVALETAPTLVHAALSSHRRWIGDGLGQFAQMLLVEQGAGRGQVLNHFSRISRALAQAEQQSTSDGAKQSTSGGSQSLITTADPAFYRTKAMFVWWMLRDMLGDEPLQRAIASYRSVDDKEPSYMQQLLEVQAKRSLETFFGDWVYRDNGLPDFKVDTVYPRQTLNKSYVITVTVENTGKAGAEVPVTVQSPQGQRTAKLLVPKQSKATVRIEFPAYPTEVVVNDGSVPESDTSNNSFTVPPPA